MGYGSGGYKGIVFNPDAISTANKISNTTGYALRYAAKSTQGQGWCKYTGTDFVSPDPLMDSLRFFNSNNEPVNMVLDEKTGRWYQTDCRQAPTNSAIVNSYTDKRSSTVAGTEITTEAKLGEHTGRTEGQTIEHLQTELRLRPREETLRSVSGYTSAGFRSAFTFNMQGYVDGVQTKTRETKLIPITGDITFDEKIEGARVQIGWTTTTSEFRIISHSNDYLQKEVGGSDTQRTMSEMTYQQNLATPVLWMGRYLRPQLNLATGVLFGGAYDSLVADTNGDSYAVKFNGVGDGFTDAISSLTGNFSLLFVIADATLPCSIYKKGSLEIQIVGGRILRYTDSDGGNTKNVQLAWTGGAGVFCYVKVCRSAATLIVGEAGVDGAPLALNSVVAYTGTDYIGDSAVATIPELRIYNSVIDAVTHGYWYDNIKNYSGNQVLGQW